MNTKALAALLVTSVTATADIPYLEFDDISLFGGTLSYGGVDGVDPLIGTDIIFDVVNGVGVPSPGSLRILDGKLNFTTGPNISEGALYTFAGGGTFTLTGTAIKPDLSVVASGILLSGYFDGTSVVVGLGGGNGLFSGIGFDEKNHDLLAFFGVLDPLFQFSNTEIGFAPTGLAPNGGFIAAVNDSDLTNAPIPEPSTYAAVISIGALVAWRRFRRS